MKQPLVSLFRKKITFITGAVILVAGALVLGVTAPKVSAADCDDNAIMYCGTGSASSFISKVKANDDGHGHHDLQAVYANYGLVPSNYAQFASSARAGTAYKNGDIVVDGQTVATGAKSIGRLASYQGSGYFKTTINGVTYYGNTDSQAFASNSIPVMAFFDSKGVLLFAVLTSCGNPIYGNNVTPTYSCNLLHSSHVSGNTYSFTTDASAAHNATITKLVYDFGDHQTATASTPGQVVKHTYGAPGNYTVTVTVYVHLPGNQTITVTSAKCATVIKIVPPPTPYYSCVELTGAILDKSKFSYSFTATAKFGNGATFKDADFDFGDNHFTKGVTPSGTTVTTSHAYATAGDYTVTATLHFNVGGAVKSASCMAKVTPQQPPTPIAPTTPTPPPAQPQVLGELVNTGPGEVIAIFIGAVIAGFLIFRQLTYRRQRAITNALAMSAEYLAHDVEAAADASKELVDHLTHRGTAHPNHANPLQHPSYHRSNRFRPGRSK